MFSRPSSDVQQMADIRYPGEHDVMLGRGGEANNHVGNIKFRELVMRYKDAYLNASRQDKPSIAWDVVLEWRGLSPPGRFLTRANPLEGASLWYDVGDEQARRRTSKTLGEKMNKRPASTDVTLCQATKKARLMASNNTARPVTPENSNGLGQLGRTRLSVQLQWHQDIQEMEKLLLNDTDELFDFTGDDEPIACDDGDHCVEEDGDPLTYLPGSIGQHIPTAAELATRFCFDF